MAYKFNCFTLILISFNLTFAYCLNDDIKKSELYSNYDQAHNAEISSDSDNPFKNYYLKPFRIQSVNSPHSKDTNLFELRSTENNESKAILVDLSALALTPQQPHLYDSSTEQIEKDQIDFIYEDLRFYLISNLNDDKSESIFEIAKQRDDYVDLTVIKEINLALENKDKLINYLKFKKILFLNKLVYENVFGRMYPKKKVEKKEKSNEVIDLLCKSKLSTDMLLRMFIINESFNRQSNKSNFFDYKNKPETKGPDFNKIEQKFSNRICSKYN